MRVLQGNVGGCVDRLAFSFDGRLAVASHGGQYVDVWDLSTDQLADYWRIKDPDHRVTDLAFLPNNELMVALTGLPPQLLTGGVCLPDTINPAQRLIVLPEANQLVVCHQRSYGNGRVAYPVTAWDMTLKPFVLLWERPNNPTTFFALTGDGKWFANCEWDERLLMASRPVLKLADLGSQKVRRRRKMQADEGDSVHVVSFSPDGQSMLAIRRRERSLELWNVSSWTAAAKSPIPHPDKGWGATCEVAMHPDGVRFSSAYHADGVVRVWDVPTLRVVAEYDWQIGRTWSIAISPDGTLAAAGGENGKIVVWDVDL